MIKVIKKQGKKVKAYCLGDENPVLEELINEKKIVQRGGAYEVFSQEAVNGGTNHGQLAKAGDYVKLDHAGFTYPNDEAFFKENHRHILGDEYEQLPRPLSAWTADEAMCKEVLFLIQNKGLLLDNANPKRYYSAVLWGTKEVAAKDAVLVFYRTTYNDDGTVKDADFNFVSRDDFKQTYDRITRIEETRL